MPGTDASRRLLAPADDTRPITLWGSSSMSSEGGDEGTPLPIRIHEHLALAAAPAVVHPFGVGATKSAHALLMRGLERPRLVPEPDATIDAADAAAGTGASGAAGTPAVTAVHLEPDLPPQGPVRCPGDVDGVAGILDGTSGTWRFMPDDPAAVLSPGTFRSALTAVADSSRQVLWLGKNNILEVEAVLEHTQRMWDATAHPAEDSLVLGHWPTFNDATGSSTGEALTEVNTEQASRYGDHFVDLQHLLTSEEGLTSAPIAHLKLMEQGSTHDALAQGVTPPLLVAEDHIHLNGWGNLLVSWAIGQRMRELRWI
ncbi:MAG: hypothetical protein DI611_07065 [Brachybacterium faecium]|nr:MAG: hypothetical protein DI611_07065 [Brachybacterium faecium]